MAKIADVVEKISETVTGGYQKIENKFSEKFLEEDGSLKTGKIGEGVIGGYKIIENGVVGGVGKVNDKFVEKPFAKKGRLWRGKKRLSRKE